MEKKMPEEDNENAKEKQQYEIFRVIYPLTHSIIYMIYWELAII